MDDEFDPKRVSACWTVGFDVCANLLPPTLAAETDRISMATSFGTSPIESCDKSTTSPCAETRPMVQAPQLVHTKKADA